MYSATIKTGDTTFGTQYILVYLVVNKMFLHFFVFLYMYFISPLRGSVGSSECSVCECRSGTEVES